MTTYKIQGKYGPNTASVEALRAKVATISIEQITQIEELRKEQDRAVRKDAWERIRYALEYKSVTRLDSWTVAWRDIWSEDIRGGILESRWVSIRDVALGVLARDLISEEDFDLLYVPWASVMEDEG